MKPGKIATACYGQRLGPMEIKSEPSGYLDSLYPAKEVEEATGRDGGMVCRRCGGGMLFEMGPRRPALCKCGDVVGWENGKRESPDDQSMV